MTKLMTATVSLRVAKALTPAQRSLPVPTAAPTEH
jgi:hypothetical protein